MTEEQKAILRQVARECFTQAEWSALLALYCDRPFETYQPQPDTAERVRRQVQSIPFALPEKRVEMQWGDIAPLYLHSEHEPGIGVVTRWKMMPEKTDG